MEWTNLRCTNLGKRRSAVEGWPAVLVFKVQTDLQTSTKAFFTAQISFTSMAKMVKQLAALQQTQVHHARINIIWESLRCWKWMSMIKFPKQHTKLQTHVGSPGSLSRTWFHLPCNGIGIVVGQVVAFLANMQSQTLYGVYAYISHWPQKSPMAVATSIYMKCLGLTSTLTLRWSLL